MLIARSPGGGRATTWNVGRNGKSPRRKNDGS
jgi:hypothetical protein